jgi:hypothetical protein
MSLKQFRVEQDELYLKSVYDGFYKIFENKYKLKLLFQMSDSIVCNDDDNKMNNNFYGKILMDIRNKLKKL